MIPENVQIPGQEEFADDEAIDAWDEQYGVRTIDLIAAAGDDRAMFYSGAGGGRRTLFPEAITGFQSGLSIVKWQNIRSDGAATSHTEYPDTDIPLLRLAEAYLTRAEASYRLNDTESAWQDICTLRNSRQCSVMPAPGEITEDYLIDEWAREFIWKAAVAVILYDSGDSPPALISGTGKEVLAKARPSVKSITASRFRIPTSTIIPI